MPAKPTHHAVLEGLARDYAHLRRHQDGLGLPDLTRVAVRIEKHSLTAEEAWAGADARTGAGWVRHRSAIHVRNGPVPRDPEGGPPLAGEWAVDARTSVHMGLCADEPGRWVTWTYSERPLQDGERPANDEEAMLREVVRVLARPDDDAQRAALAKPSRGSRQRVLVYHVFWSGAPDDPYAIARRFARFVGFADAPLARWKDRA